MACGGVALRTTGLSKEFGNRPVLRRIDLAISVGRCLGLTGANGAGKTTLLRCLAGLVRPTAGAVEWFGEPAGKRCDQRRLIGLVGHESRLYPHLTLRENLTFAARLYGLAKPQHRADEWLERSGLTARAALHPTQLSRGMNQRLALARALIHDPPILLLDEPFSGLDGAAREWLLEILARSRQQKRTVCLSSHDLEPLHAAADVVFELRDGNLEEQQRPSDLRRVA